MATAWSVTGGVTNEGRVFGVLWGGAQRLGSSTDDPACQGSPGRMGGWSVNHAEPLIRNITCGRAAPNHPQHLCAT